ncbi:MAG TPA: pyridoxamine 5'-phosphate oxidase family protein [Chloroflexia bacterium]|nr:pyridoxamine 5'-phosphate oxidase family protein [Chloroflexia bacterium]
MATTNREPTAERNLDGYGAPPIPWPQVRERLEQGLTQEPGSGGPDRHTCWLATTGPDGRPHVMPLGVLWVAGALYFTAGPGTRKAQNLAANPHCVLTVATQEFDLVVEGPAVRVSDPALAERIAAVYRAQGWPAQVSAGGAALTADYSAPSAGPPPWDLYAVTPETIYALGTAAPYGATRWRFPEAG